VEKMYVHHFTFHFIIMVKRKLKGEKLIIKRIFRQIFNQTNL